MEIFNIGPLEFIVILVLMFILLGPKEMILTARRIGVWVRKIIQSPMWRDVMGYSAEIRELPKKMMDESGLQDALDEIQQTTKETTQELNATIQDANNQIKDAVKEGSVTELEHVRVDSPAASVPAAAPTGYAEVASMVAPQAPVEVEAAADAAPAVSAGAVAVETEASAATDVNISTAPVESTEPAVEVPPAEKKTRRKKAAPEPAVLAAPTDAPETPAPKRARKPRVKPETPAAGEVIEIAPPADAAPLNGGHSTETTTGQAESEAEKPARRPRKPRTPKVTQPQPDGAETEASAVQVYPQEQTQNNDAV